MVMWTAQRNFTKPRNGNKNPRKSLLEKVGVRRGWTYEWTIAQHAYVKSIIPGPFLQPKLVSALPYSVTSNCENCIRKSAVEQKLRSGIPDPWLEYIAWKEHSSSKDGRNSWEYMWLTDFVWNNRGLAMVQGIPDPWRVDFDCSHCFGCRTDVLEDTRKQPKRNRAKEDRGELSRASEERDLKGKRGEKKPDLRNKKERNDFEKVKDRMSKLEGELKLKNTGKKRILRRTEKVTGSIAKAAKSESFAPEKAISGEKPIKKIPINTSRDTRGKAKVSFERFKDEIKRCNDDVTKIRKDTKLAQKKIQQLRERTERPSRQKDNDDYTACVGKCGRVLRKEKLLKSIKLYDNGCDNESTITTTSVASVKDFLREIDNRIEITKNALNSLDLKNLRIPEKNGSKSKRERGAGDNLDETIDLQPKIDLFTRRSVSAIPIHSQDSKIPDHVDIESSCFEQCYRKTSLLFGQNCATNESQALIVEPFSEQD